MDIGLLGGIIAGFALVVFGIVSGGTALTDFIDVGSVLIVVGGGISATFVQMPLTDMLGIGKTFGKALKNPEFNTGQIIDKVI